MNVPFQLRVPVDLTIRLRDRLAELQTANLAAMDRVKKRADLTEYRALVELRKRLTINNLLRVVLTNGTKTLHTMSDHDLMARLSQDDIVRGRPRGS